LLVEELLLLLLALHAAALHYIVGGRHLLLRLRILLLGGCGRWGVVALHLRRA
jgi:hypothetical protein